MVEYTYRNKTYVAYTEEEAKEKGIDYVYWKDAQEEGQWCLSDDGMVSMAHRYKVYSTKYRTRKYIRLNNGRYWESETWYFFAPKKKSNGTNGKAELYRRGAIPALKCYARLLLKDEKITEEQWMKLGKIFRKDEKRPDLTFKKLLKYKEAKEVVAKELEQLLGNKGITASDVIENYLDIQEKAKQTFEDDRNITALSIMKQVNDQFAKMLDMRPQKTQAQLDVGVETIDWGSLPDPTEREELTEYTLEI